MYLWVTRFDEEVYTRAHHIHPEWRKQCLQRMVCRNRHIGVLINFRLNRVLWVNYVLGCTMRLYMRYMCI